MEDCRRSSCAGSSSIIGKGAAVTTGGIRIGAGLPASPDWLKMKNADAPAVRREEEEEWGKKKRWVTNMNSGLRKKSFLFTF
jgi:hypothetical protein